MSRFVCPWWLGHALASPLRRVFQDPAAVLYPHVRRGMTVLEPGPGMGFFTLELAWLVGSEGRVVAIDVQPKMLQALRERASRAGLGERIETRLGQGDRLGTDDLAGKVDFALAFAIVHELPAEQRFFEEVLRTLKPEAKLLVSEPRMHVSARKFDATLRLAENVGFRIAAAPAVRWSRTALLERACCARAPRDQSQECGDPRG
jgi:ubiquinone/menaquinone biosynthesis C-methylase UbiE